MLNSYFPLARLRTSCKKTIFILSMSGSRKLLIFIAKWQDLPHYPMIYTNPAGLQQTYYVSIKGQPVLVFLLKTRKALQYISKVTL